MDLHEMKLFDSTSIKGTNIKAVRVPSGWICQHQISDSLCFVPYSDEFGPETTREKAWSELRREEGVTAFHHGKTMDDCPYTYHNPAYYSWRMGYRTAEFKAKEILNKGE